MRILVSPLLLLLVINQLLISQQTPIDKRLQPAVNILQEQGKDPVKFVIDKLDKYDLIIFDDAWHPAVEPFEFYQQLIRNPLFFKKVKYVFIEVFSINKQPHLDEYFNSEKEDRTLLYPAFQDDFSGKGWSLQTYFDLLSNIYKLNQSLPENQRVKIIGVNNPTYWREIKTRDDIQYFRKTLLGNDYTMYKTILTDMDNFQSGRKGIFLTNTRHAYKGIKNKQGQYFWNCGTFFHQWHPGKTFSIRFHNMALFIEKEKKPDSSTPTTTAGMEKINSKWVRIGNGLWDSAFRANGNRPVAFPLKDNLFGAEPYIGNHMHKAAPNQTMFDANDAVIFLAPLEELHTSAIVDFIYTDDFKKELVRRYRLLYKKQQLENKFDKYSVSNIKELIDKEFISEPKKLIPQVNSLEPIDAWKGAQ